MGGNNLLRDKGLGKYLKISSLVLSITASERKIAVWALVIEATWELRVAKAKITSGMLTSLLTRSTTWGDVFF